MNLSKLIKCKCKLCQGIIQSAHPYPLAFAEAAAFHYDVTEERLLELKQNIREQCRSLSPTSHTHTHTYAHTAGTSTYTDRQKYTEGKSKGP